VKLYPFQRQAVEFHLKARYSINASEMGVGKSIIALDSMQRAGLNNLVFGPAFLEANWYREAERYGVDIEYYRYSALKKLGTLSQSPDLKPKKFSIVLDEAHYLKNPKAKRTVLIDHIIRTLKPEYLLLLTGTPIKNRIPDIYTLIRFCSMNPYPTNGVRLPVKPQLTEAAWHRFASRFCIRQDIHINGFRIPKYTQLKKGADVAIRALLADKYLRVTAAEVLPDLPSITRVPVPGKFLEDTELSEAWERYLESGKVDSRAKADSALLKVPFTQEYVTNILEQRLQVLIFTDHRKPAFKLASFFKCPAITGSTPMEDRAKYVAGLQSGQLRVLVATIGALSVGVTLTAANHVVFNDISWVPSDNAQAEKRIHRIGQAKPCFAHYIETSETDAYIGETVREKMDTIGEIIDG
jgi:SWI/SNF-related matrix-associated actin-dependent regulator 1 of chromatin subfamily A